jgi:anti-sigma-K factor RskA
VQGPDGPELDVTAAGLPLQQGYYEVWVFDGTVKMVAVGVLGADSTASLALPPTLDLRTYHVVDISLEQYDGDQTHSQVSVLRGTLTS